MDTLLPLIGVLIGGLITYLTTRALDGRRWQREKKDRLQERQREALALALDWLAPIEAAWIRASGSALSLIHGRISEDEFLNRWPDLLSALSKRDIPAPLRVLLPHTAYEKGFEIIEHLDALNDFSLAAQARDGKSILETCDQFVQHEKQFKQTLKMLEQELVEAYKKTFE